MIASSKDNIWDLDPSLCIKIFKKDILLPIMECIKDSIFHYGDDSTVIYSYMLNIKTLYITHKSYYFHRHYRNTNTIAPYFMDDNFYEKLYYFYCQLKNILSQSEYKNILVKQLDFLYARSAKLGIRKYKQSDFQAWYALNFTNDIKYIFPFDKVQSGSKIILYGAGMVGTTYYKQITKISYCTVTCWVDKNYQEYKELNIEPIEHIKNYEYDYIVIANANLTIYNQIKKDLIKMNIVDTNII